MAECSNCRYWDVGTKETRKCLISKSKNPMMFSGCGLFTRKDFCCKLFKEKK